MYSRPWSSQTVHPDERVIRDGRLGSCEPKSVSGRLLPVEVKPAMCSVTVAPISTKCQKPEPLGILPITSQPDPSTPSTPNPLPHPASTIRQHAVDQEIEFDRIARMGDRPARRSDGKRHGVTPFGRLPAPPSPAGVRRAVRHGSNDKISSG